MSSNAYYFPFHLKNYWEKQHESITTPEEWYIDLTTYYNKKFNINLWNKEQEILILGVGYSKLIDHLIAKNFKHVTLVDFSENLMNFLTNKYSNLESCAEWDCKLFTNSVVALQDINRLTKDGLIPESFYDIIIDKACLDCVLSDPDGEEKFKACIHEVLNALTINGIFYYISTGKPDRRINMITSVDVNLKIDIEEISNRLPND